MIKVKNYKDCFNAFSKHANLSGWVIEDREGNVCFQSPHDANVFEMYVYAFKQGEIAALKETNEYIKNLESLTHEYGSKF